MTVTFMDLGNIVGGFVRSSLSYSSDLILPPLCVGCAALIDRHHALCPVCWRDLDLITPPICDRTGVPLPGSAGPGPHLSTDAMLQPPEYARARAAAIHSGLMRRLIVRFKFEDRHEALPFFTRLMSEAGRDLIASAEVIVPVPLHPLRLLQRRYNQSALLARALARETKKPLALSVLRRVRRTTPQVGLDRAARAQNVNAAFAVNGARRAQIAGKRVLLIDDVLTTGATVGACARTLKSAGALAVDVLALAMAKFSDDAAHGHEANGG